jgi:hypothetical protein
METSGQLHAFNILSWGKAADTKQERRPSGLHSWFGHEMKVKNSMLLPEIKPSNAVCNKSLN